MKERMGAEHYGAERRETAEAHAEGMVAEELKRRGWEAAELGRRAKGDAQKLVIAARLRAETEVTVRWIAERLRMGAPGYVHHLLYRRRKVQGA
jgi:pyruvoyl-dependent arginine decarboxylase (PvlArgDC)